LLVDTHTSAVAAPVSATRVDIQQSEIGTRPTYW